MKRAQLTKLLGVTGGVIADTFRRMEIAEEIVDRHFPRRGKPSAQNSLAFKVACPPVLLRNKGDDLYRAHLEELCQRIKRHSQGVGNEIGAEHWINLATDAEMLAAFSDTSLRAPLRHGAGLIMNNLFASCFPKQAALMKIKRHELEPMEREELEDARRKLSKTVNRMQ